ncbi:hypothetical protein PsYK624_020060 [Phanerochaete sordida]|uniref:Uncharacterized protein n=1 Tax=Phanerochaete sordida TaxID=48140 RepID=A0A9P3G0E1_9APHY|nr:hypothetical protein PsYK624_020060 [Phanerochaete sordida]
MNASPQLTVAFPSFASSHLILAYEMPGVQRAYHPLPHRHTSDLPWAELLRSIWLLAPFCTRRHICDSYGALASTYSEYSIDGSHIKLGSNHIHRAPDLRLPTLLFKFRLTRL